VSDRSAEAQGPPGHYLVYGQAAGMVCCGGREQDNGERGRRLCAAPVLCDGEPG
jgi:hypothetical protein